jgi:C1A family cysteine protease
LFSEKYANLIARGESDEERLAGKLQRLRLEKVVLESSGAIKLPTRIPLKRIRKQSLAGLEKFQRELEKQRKKQKGKGLEVFPADFIELIKNNIGERQRRPGTMGELVSALPYFDWRLTGIVNAPRNQGHCNSCWAFAAAEAFESRLMYNVNRPRLFSLEDPTPVTQIALSVQGVLDCVSGGSCEGGHHADAFDHFGKKGARLFDLNEEGIPIDDSAALMGKQGPCKEEDESGIKALAWCFVFESNPVLVPRGEASIRTMKRALLEYGTLAVLVTKGVDSEFDHYREENYRRGVFRPRTDPRVSMGDHEVLLTGWDDDRNAWIIVNSFGRDWGGRCVDLKKVREHFPWTMPNARNLRKERGCMYIERGARNIGQMAAWIETPLDNEKWLKKARRENG